MPPPARNTTEVLNAIVTVVAPYLGETMARSAAQAHRQKLGIDGLEASEEQIEALIRKISSGLNVFVGRDRSSAIVAEIRGALAVPEQTR
jgi:hypothetical protein